MLFATPFIHLQQAMLKNVSYLQISFLVYSIAIIQEMLTEYKLLFYMFNTDLYSIVWVVYKFESKHVHRYMLTQLGLHWLYSKHRILRHYCNLARVLTVYVSMHCIQLFGLTILHMGAYSASMKSIAHL